MGGRGFPYCTIMNADGEVIWEVRPTDEETWHTALDKAKKLQAMKASLEKHPDDAALAANIALLDASGRSQRPMPDISELEKLAETKGVDPVLKAEFDKLKVSARIRQAMGSAQSDGGAAVYALWKEGAGPADNDGQAIGFYRYAVDGAISAKHAADAKQLLDKFVELGSKLERYRERVKADAEKLQAEIDALSDG
jgi:hypothetical protein